MAAFIHKNETALPNATKPVHDIQPSDLVYLDDHPCKMSNPPKIFQVQSTSGDGHAGEIDKGLVVVRGVSVVDGEEYEQMYSEDGVVRYFVDDHDEREWLVVRASLQTSCKAEMTLMSYRFSLQTGREGMKVFVQAPGDPSIHWTLWMQPESRIPCFWLLARNLPGHVCMCT